MGARWDREARQWYDPTHDGRLQQFWTPLPPAEGKPKLPRDDPSKRRYIKVTYMQRHHAKCFGARWDPAEKLWYIPSSLNLAQVQELLNSYPETRAQTRRTMQRILEVPAPPRLINPKTHSPVPLSAGDSTRTTRWDMSEVPTVSAKPNADGSWRSVHGDEAPQRHTERTPTKQSRDRGHGHHKHHRVPYSPSTHSGAVSVNEGGPPFKPNAHAPAYEQDGAVRRGNAHLTGPSPQLGRYEEPPGCAVLTTTDRRDIALWRKQLQTFEKALMNYNMRNRCRYNPPLSLFVHPSTWATISEQLLSPTDMTRIGSPTNDAAVEEYLRGVGRYAKVHGMPGELYFAEPIQEYRNLDWPQHPTLSFVTAFDIYVSRWRGVTTSLPEVDRPPDAELAPIMRDAIHPEWLRRTITRKIESGKGPELVGHTTQWRKRASEDVATLMTVIRENAHMAQMLRKSPALHQWSPEAKFEQMSAAQVYGTPQAKAWRQPATLAMLHLQTTHGGGATHGAGIMPQPVTSLGGGATHGGGVMPRPVTNLGGGATHGGGFSPQPVTNLGSGATYGGGFAPQPVTNLGGGATHGGGVMPQPATNLSGGATYGGGFMPQPVTNLGGGKTHGGGFMPQPVTNLGGGTTRHNALGPQPTAAAGGGVNTPGNLNAIPGNSNPQATAGQTPPKNEAPRCPHPGCNRKLKQMRDGGYFRTCYDHSPQGIAAAAARAAAPARTCILEGCNKPRAISTNGAKIKITKRAVESITGSTARHNKRLQEATRHQKQARTNRRQELSHGNVICVQVRTRWTCAPSSMRRDVKSLQTTSR